MRFKLTVEYDGGPFHGWQRLSEGPSVQDTLERAVERLTGERAEVIGAGRTDAGVHAVGQVAHVDIDKPFDAWRLSEALNAHLRPAPVAIVAAAVAPPGFHARFSATRRVYRYTIINRRAPLAIDAGKAWRKAPALDDVKMTEAALRLLGQHDFTTFRDSQCQAKSPIKTLDAVRIERRGERLDVWFEAQSFLHRQVRSMVGTLVEVGLGKMSADDLSDALAARDRARCGPVAPAEGLYLMRVVYGDPAK